MGRTTTGENKSRYVLLSCVIYVSGQNNCRHGGQNKIDAKKQCCVEVSEPI